MKYGIDRLSLAQKIGQIIMPRLDFAGSNTLDYAKELVERYKVGSFIVMRGGCEDTGGAIRELQNVSPIPLILGCDAERGLGQILSGSSVFPFTMALGAIDDESLVYRQARFIADEMRAQGLNMIFAPVLDVNSNPDNPIIGIRSYGDDPSKVSRLGSSFIRGSQDNGIMACAKHYPGHGSSDIDSHIDLPILSRSIEEFLKSDLIPFQEAIRVGVSSIMTAHIAAPRIDENLVPATFSNTLISDVLFHRLEFGGLVISDSFHMEALSRYGDEVDMASHALAAGCDIILDPIEPAGLIEGLTTRVKDGRISTARLEEAVKKVLTAKATWLDGPPGTVLRGENTGLKILDEVARRSVCLLKGGELDNDRVKVFVFDVTQASDEPSKAFVGRLLQAGIQCEVEVIRRFDAEVPFQIAPGCRQAIICLTYTSVGAWKDYYRLPEAVKLFLKRLGKADCDKFLISFGSPYVVRELENFDTIICAFDRLDACQIAAAEVLLGKLKPEGVLPVRLSQL